MYMLCRHIKPDGVRCQAPALKEMPYCFFHDHYHREAIKNLKKTKNKTKNRPVDLPRLVNRGSVLEALSDVIGALGAGRLDSSTAGRLIYGLQVAGQFAQESEPEDSPKAVQTFTVAEDGAEMANELFICEEDDRCEGCFRIEYCQLDEAKEFRAARADKPDAETDDEENNDPDNDDDVDEDEEDDE